MALSVPPSDAIVKAGIPHRVTPRQLLQLFALPPDQEPLSACYRCFPALKGLRVLHHPGPRW